MRGEAIVRVVAERVVGRDEVPALALLEQRGPYGARKHVARARRAERHLVRFGARDVRIVRARREEEDAVLLRDRGDGESDAGRQAAGEHVDLLLRDQTLGFVRADGRLARIVASNDLEADARVGLRLASSTASWKPDCCDSEAAA